MKVLAAVVQAGSVGFDREGSLAKLERLAADAALEIRGYFGRFANPGTDEGLQRVLHGHVGVLGVADGGGRRM